jgi:hypothetical protein
MHHKKRRQAVQHLGRPPRPRSTRLLSLTVHDVLVSDAAVELAIEGHTLRRPPVIDQPHLDRERVSSERWAVNQTASTTPWLYPGQDPARPIRSEYVSLLLRRHGFGGLAGRDSARLALACDLALIRTRRPHRHERQQRKET